ncbi:MAG TPA: hypothetical protein VF062_12615 [Candidatus Limnocylindrales bacterium]
MIRRTVAVALAAIAAAAVIGWSAPAQAAQVCSYNQPLSVNGFYWLTATTCIERTGAYIRGSVWIKNTSTVNVYIDSNIATEHGGAFFFKGWMTPGYTSGGASKWLIDIDVPLNHGYSVTHFYTTAGGWRYNLVAQSPAG